MDYALVFAEPSAVIILITATLSYFLTIPQHINPFFLYYIIQHNIAKRLYQPTNSAIYQYLASTAIAFLCLSISLTLVFGLLSFAYYPEILEAVLLFLCISNPLAKSALNRVPFLLAKGQNSAVKEIIRPLLRRNVDKLSETGIIKATIETKSLRCVREFFIPLFLFYFLGIEIAFCYRLVLVTHYSWSAYCNVDSLFIKSTAVILYIIEYLPLRLFSLTMSLGKCVLSLRLIHLYNANFYNQNSGYLLSVVSAKQQCQIGGPSYYHNKRFAKTRISQFDVPEISHLKSTDKMLNKTLLLWASILILLEFLYVATS